MNQYFWLDVGKLRYSAMLWLLEANYLSFCTEIYGLEQHAISSKRVEGYTREGEVKDEQSIYS
jgi:hypothetical protein